MDSSIQGLAVSAPTPAPVVIDLAFPHRWRALILPARPAILPARHFVYPRHAEEVERGALEVLIWPEAEESPQFLATCALGFRDPAVPTGLWSTPNPNEVCAISGGYAYLIDTSAPQRFTMLPSRPVLQVFPALSAGLLLFVGHRTILAWGLGGQAWESEILSDEGLTILSIGDSLLRCLGWEMRTDKETPITLDILTGLRVVP